MEARRIPLNPYLEADIIDSIFRANGRNQKGLRRDNDRDSSKDRPIDNDDEIVDEEVHEVRQFITWRGVIKAPLRFRNFILLVYSGGDPLAIAKGKTCFRAHTPLDNYEQSIHACALYVSQSDRFLSFYK
jgi:hypothetical protein